MGRTAEARSCFSRAVELGPRIPSVLNRAARFHFGLGEKREAIDLTARALAGNPELDQTAFSEYDQRNIAVEGVLRHGLPTDALVWRSYLRWQIGHDRTAATATGGKTMLAGNRAGAQLAGEYIEY